MRPLPTLHTFILLSALALGIAGDLLLRESPWGVNWTLWCFIFAGIMFALVRAPASHATSVAPPGPEMHLSGERLARGWLFMLCVAAACAVFVAWRDAPALVAFDVLAALIETGDALVALELDGVVQTEPGRLHRAREG